MVKMTKTQARNTVKAIWSKAKRLYLQPPGATDAGMTVKDLETIDRLCRKWSNKLK
jgi:hypothetical protein